MSNNPSQNGTAAEISRTSDTPIATGGIGTSMREVVDTVQSDIDIVKLHVTNSEVRVGAQRKLIAILAAQRQPLKQARELLQLFEVTWQAHVDHLLHVEEFESHRARPRRDADMRTRRREAADELRVCRGR